MSGRARAILGRAREKDDATGGRFCPLACPALSRPAPPPLLPSRLPCPLSPCPSSSARLSLSPLLCGLP
eukprot:5624743-Prymnesium_polylepis.1